MTIRRIIRTGTVKALTGENADHGSFEAWVAVFGNVDFHGERILASSLDESLARWKAGTDPIPVIFSHRWDDLDAHVGEVDPANINAVPPGDPRLPVEIRNLGGLHVVGQLYMDEDTPSRLWRRLRGRTIREFSWAFDVLEEQIGQDGRNEVVSADLIEVGPTLKGANPLTSLVDVKASGPATLLASLADLDIDPAALAERVKARAGETTIPPHTFVADDGDDRCILCGLTADTAAHHTEAVDPDTPDVKTKTRRPTFDGSVEQRLEALFGQVDEWARSNNIGAGGHYLTRLEATWPDRVLFSVEGWNDPMGEGDYFEASIVTDDDGVESIAEPVRVELVGTTRRLDRPMYRHEKARHGAATEPVVKPVAAKAGGLSHTEKIELDLLSFAD